MTIGKGSLEGLCLLAQKKDGGIRIPDFEGNKLPSEHSHTALYKISGDKPKKKDGEKTGKQGNSEVPQGVMGSNGLPTIDGQTAPWSLEYIAEKALEILSHPATGVAADLVDEMRFTKGAGHVVAFITVAGDSYQYFYKQSIDDMTFYYRITTTGLAYVVGFPAGIAVGLYSTGIENTARTGAELETQMRRYFNPTTKGSFWSKFYW